MKRIVLYLCAALAWLTTLPAAAAQQAEKSSCTLNVATFNLRMDTPKDGDNAWPNRKEMVKGLIRFHDFDIFGTQEGFKHQLDNILELGNYAYIGAGRDDGKEAGEHSAIFYKKDRFEVLDKGNFWFSETPDVPGKGWDAVCCNRICSWGKFKDKVSGQVFFFFNSHYDHQGKNSTPGIFSPAAKENPRDSRRKGYCLCYRRLQCRSDRRTYRYVGCRRIAAGFIYPFRNAPIWNRRHIQQFPTGCPNAKPN